MRPPRDLFGPTPDEAMANTLDAHALAEVCACQDLRRQSASWRAMPAQLRAGLAAGRLELRRGNMAGLSAYRVHRRLAHRRVLRRGSDLGFVTMVHPDHGTLRLPFA